MEYLDASDTDLHSRITELPLIAPSPKRDRREGADRRRDDAPAENPADQRQGAPRRQLMERRAAPRATVELDCEEREGESRYFRTTSNLSTFGVGTHGGFTHPVGTRLRLLIYLPDEPRRPVELEAVVASVGRGPSAAMRLVFRNPSVATVRRIHRFLVATLEALR